jgi:heme-binding protein
MKAWIKRSLLVVLFVALAIQIFRPPRANPATAPRHDVTIAATVHPQVAATMQRACRDCHSNETRWPWYSNVAPVSWVVAYDVNAGRRAMNLSTWGQYSPKTQQELLGDMCEEVQSGEMPDAGYRMMHAEARLTPADVEAVCAWTKSAGAGMQREEVKD